jgi:hypothetical protein
VRALDGDDVVAITATEAARTNASERKMKVFTANSEPTANQLWQRYRSSVSSRFRPTLKTVSWRFCSARNRTWEAGVATKSCNALTINGF